MFDFVFQLAVGLFLHCVRAFQKRGDKHSNWYIYIYPILLICKHFVNQIEIPQRIF